MLTYRLKLWYNVGYGKAKEEAALMGHKIPERPDDGRDEMGQYKKRDFFERQGAAKSMGKTLTQADYKALEVLREMVRGYWTAFVDVVTAEKWRAMIEVRIEQAMQKDAQGNKAFELLARYALGDKAPTGTERKTRLEILVKQILESPLVLDADEVTAIATVEERHGVLAHYSANASAPAPSESETSDGRGAGGEK